MEIGNTFYAETREEWRAWLQANHASEAEVWLKFYNKAAGRPCVSYNESV